MKFLKINLSKIFLFRGHVVAKKGLLNNYSNKFIFGYRDNYPFLNLFLSLFFIKRGLFIISEVFCYFGGFCLHVPTFFQDNILFYEYFDESSFYIFKGRWFPGFLTNFREIWNLLENISEEFVEKQVEKIESDFFSGFISFDELKLLKSKVEIIPHIFYLPWSVFFWKPFYSDSGLGETSKLSIPSISLFDGSNGFLISNYPFFISSDNILFLNFFLNIFYQIFLKNLIRSPFISFI